MGTYLAKPVTTKETKDGVGLGALRYASASMQGWRMSQEDAHIALPHFDDHRGLSLFGVFDGHGGCAVSRLVAESLPQKLSSSVAFRSGNYPAALRDAFLGLDRFLDSPHGRHRIRTNAEESRQALVAGFNGGGGLAADLDIDDVLGDLCSDNPNDMGCTAIVALVEHGGGPTGAPVRLHVANCGDSRCVLWDNRGKITAMSKDHKPGNKEERARVEAAGGCVNREGRIEGNLNLSRALGDFDYKRTRKKQRPEKQMISGVPEVRSIELGPSARFLFLGCDGVWEAHRGSKTVVDLLRKLLPVGRHSKLSAGLGRLFDSILASNSSESLGQDNMTAVLVELAAQDTARGARRSAPRRSKGVRARLRRGAARTRAGPRKRGVRRGIGKKLAAHRS